MQNRAKDEGIALLLRLTYSKMQQLTKRILYRNTFLSQFLSSSRTLFRLGVIGKNFKCWLT